MRLAHLFFLLAVLGGAACEHRPAIRARKHDLGVLPLAWRRRSIDVADDGAHLTFSVRDGAGYYVVAPSGRGPTYADVGSPVFAPGSTRVLYWGAHRDDGGRRYEIVADGAPVPTPFVEPIELVYAAGGARWAALGFAPPSAGGATPAARPMAVVLDGHEMGRYAAASRPAFSPDGTHVAWLARERDGRVAVIVDGAPVRTLDAAPPPDGAPRFDRLARVTYLSDGRLLALVPEQDGWALWRGDERLATYGSNRIPDGPLDLAGNGTKASIVAGSLVTAEHAPVAVWWERMPGAAERLRVVRDGAPVDGVVCDHYPDAEPSVLSDDGVHVAYACPTPAEPGAPLGRQWVVLDGRRFGTYVKTWTLGVSPDGAQVAYGAAETLPIMTGRIFVNGVPRSSPAELVWRPRVSPDGAHVLWAGGPERGRRELHVDGRVVTRFDDVLHGPEFPAPATAEWVIRRGRKISRIDVRF